jgi:acyl-CoA reductase-like NAD-dependent aldehyde dehydrogenase
MREMTYEPLLIEPAGVPRGRAMVERADWAARAYAKYDIATVNRIVDAAAAALAARAQEFARDAVAETGFGVVEHKLIKNLACSTGIVESYRGQDFVTPEIDEANKIVAIPRPAGVVLALTPSTNPVATVSFKIILALMTRNAIIISPHPMAKRVCVAAAKAMADAAVSAGAPDGIIQIVEDPSIPLINALMTDERTDVIVATGGNPVVRSAYRSGNPAIGVGPGNVPVLVDATADLAKTAARIIESKSFDNSVLCTNESVVIAEESIADKLLTAFAREGAYVLKDDERDAVRDAVFPGGNFNTKMVGKDATWIAEQAGIKVPAKTRVLVAPFELAVPEEPLAHEKLCPVLGFIRVPTASRGIEIARAILRITGSGHSAAIHSSNPELIMMFSAAVPVLRVCVNVGNSLGASGIQTHLPPTMTIGTGFVGRSSVGENLQPKHLINYTRLAYNSDVREVMPSFAGLNPWTSPAGPVPAYPAASNERNMEQVRAPIRREPISQESAELRDEIRRLIVEELHALIKN